MRAFTIRLLLVGLLLPAGAALLVPSGRAGAVRKVAAETRCGWFSNPTPGNASLHDREDEWLVGVQGGHQADGDWPEFGRGQWVETNVHYGYGCACMSVEVDRESHHVLRILSARARPLSACRRDRALKHWGFR